MGTAIEEMYGILENGQDEYLMHYGVKFRSGRYPYGSGEDPYQHDTDFLGRIEKLKANGWTETAENIKKEFGEDVTLNDYRNEKSWCNYEKRLREVETAKRLYQKEGLGYTEIGRRMGKSESTVRSLLNEQSESRMKVAKETADRLKKAVDEKGMIDVGADVEKTLNISKTMLNTALYKLESEGYVVYTGGIPQPTNKGQQTTQKVLCKPGTKHKEIYDYDKVKTIDDYVSIDGGKTFQKKFTYPESLDSKRLKIRYDEEGGTEKDGLVEIRRGVADLSLGESRCSQVRIMVDGTHYIKGMAVYSDNLPKGVDVVFNTNKSNKLPMKDVLKKIKDDPDNPFGSLIKDAEQGGQYWYDPKTGERVGSDKPGAKLGLINKRADEGDWSDWKDTLPSQFLSKQSQGLAKRQLSLAQKEKMAEYESIKAIDNPTIRKHLLDKFADSCDSASVHLKAAALPGQKYHVIIPINTLKDNEIYAPNYPNGSKLALVRYPHGGTFEIPILTVNNRHAPAKKLLGTEIKDAVGINKKIADQLSGADFDGDTVMCIPTHNSKIHVSSRKPLKELEGFDPKISYQYDKKVVDSKGKVHYYRDGVEFPGMVRTDLEMGKISNLITDMTLANAKDSELARAVKHSMVVIDAEKHGLDYRRSASENNIAELKKKYQKTADADGNVVKTGGASTIISRAKHEEQVDKREGSPIINIKGSKDYDPSRPEGALIWKTARPSKLYKVESTRDKDTGYRTLKTLDGTKVTYDPKDPKALEKYSPVKHIDPDTGDVTFTNKDGTLQYRREKIKQNSTSMAETDDARTLVSAMRHPMELLYADHANYMKSLANTARKERMSTGNLEFHKEAKEKYANEVASLNKKLNDAKMNSVRERSATRLANAEISRKKREYYEVNGKDMPLKDEKKIAQQAVSKYREEVGSVSRKKRNIVITDKEWEAIQAGAIHENKLKDILNNSDIDSLRERATPKEMKTLTKAQEARIKALQSNGYTIAEIALKFGKSPSTISNYLKG